MYSVDTSPCELWRIVEKDGFANAKVKKRYAWRIRHEFPDVSDNIVCLQARDSHLFIWDRETEWVYDWFCGCCMGYPSAACRAIRQKPKKGKPGRKAAYLDLSRSQVTMCWQTPHGSGIARATTFEERRTERQRHQKKRVQEQLELNKEMELQFLYYV